MHHGVPFGRFVLVRKLGGGGMGELFLARPKEKGALPDQVALKRIHPAHRDDVAFAQSLIDEAVIGCQLVHPNVVKVFEVGEVEGDVYVAMEYVAGASLAAVIPRGTAPCPWGVALQVGLELCDALTYLHRAVGADGRPLHLVHRDVSPANVMLEPGGAVRLIDFGIARATVSRDATRPGEIKANLAWAAPEQLNGAAVDARADVWGAGACLFALLTQATTPRERPLRAARPDVPEPFAAAVEACLQTLPDDRVASAAALRKRLEAALGAGVSREAVGAWVRPLLPPAASDEAPAATQAAAKGTRPAAAPATGRAERFRPGDQLARCTILGRLGGGGMGELWLARQLGSGQFEKTLLLKTISGEVAQRPSFVRMFLEEARLAALINHANVVQVFDCGEDRGCYYLSMEYLDGRDVTHVARALKDKGEALPLHVAARVAAECAAGLDFAHGLTDARGQSLKLVHRDVAPDNVLVTYSGQVKLLDFGIAKVASSVSDTAIGTFKGKLSYASPEQVHNRPIDRRADVWSLGVVLYEMAVGLKPFSAPSELELMRAIVSTEPRPPSRLRAMPAELERVILRALRKEPAERYPDAASMRGELEAFLAGQPPTSPYHLAQLMEGLFPASTDPTRARVLAMMTGATAAPVDAEAPLGTVSRTIAVEPPYPPRKRRRRWPIAAALVVALLGAGAILYPKPQPQPVVLAPAPQPLTPPQPEPQPSPEPQPDEPEDPPPPDEEPKPPGSASLAIACNVPCDVFLDSRRAGRAPVSLHPKPGKHTVRAVASGAGRAERTLSIVLKEGESATRRLVFGSGELIVRALPWADVSIDGKPVGQTPLPKLELLEGKHEVVFKNSELKVTQRRSVLIKSGEAQELSVTLGQ